MTWDRYGHLYDDDLDSVAERLSTARAGFSRTVSDNGGTSSS
jgi:hypothetical protein